MTVTRTTDTTSPTPSSNASQVTTTLILAIVIWAIAVVAPKFIIPEPITSLMTTQGLELLLTLQAIAILGRKQFARYGFCLPKADTRWMLVMLTAPMLGIVATVAILALDGSGNPIVRRLSLPQIIIFVWFSSSIVEEVFTRGFVQGHLHRLSGMYARLGFIRIEWPVLISALFFACMHLILPFVGADAATTVVVFLFALSIGLMAGVLRSSTGSVIPAIGAHMLANIGGFVGGIIYTIIAMLAGR